MAEGEGFEPPDPFRSSHFKCDALSQTLPSFLKNGAPDPIRTDDIRITKATLYQLSYKGEKGPVII